MTKKRGCNRHPGSSRCLKKIGGLNCTSVECAKSVKISMDNKKVGNFSEIKDDREIIGKYCRDCHQEASVKEKSCIRCGSGIFIARYAEDDQGIIIPSVDVCRENPDLSQMASYCPI